MKVVYYHRRPTPGSHSIERVFDTVRRALPAHVQVCVAQCRYPSRGVLPRLYNAVEAIFRQGDVNHITGDIHYVGYFLRKDRTLLTVHDCVTLNRLTGFDQWILKQLWYSFPMRRSSLVSVISEFSKTELLQRVPFDASRVRVVYDPVGDEFAPCPKPFPIEEPVILQVGTKSNKNLFRVIEAIQGIPCRLDIVGHLSQEQRLALNSSGVNYSASENLTDAEIVDKYRSCDILLFASTYEGFGMPIVEANAIGRPVITSNVCSMPEIAGDAAHLVDPFDSNAIRDGIHRLIQDASYRETLIQNGFSNAKRFRPHAIAQMYIALYSELMKYPARMRVTPV